MREYDIFKRTNPMTESEFVKATAHVITEEQAKHVFDIVFQQARQEDDWPHEETVILCWRGNDSVGVGWIRP